MKPEERSMKKFNMPAKVDLRDIQGRILAPVALYALGVPFGIVLLLWLFFFRG